MEWNNKVGAMHGLDMAFPFLDRDLIAFLIATPGEIHSFSGVPKGILREALQGVLPDAIAQRASKADFTEVANLGVLQDYDGVVACLREGGKAFAMGYLEQDWAQHVERAKASIDGESALAGWAVTDLLALELWLETFFDSRTDRIAPVGASGAAH